MYESTLIFKELEQIEEHWRQESHDLVAMVTRLQEENRKLLSSLAEREDDWPDGAGDYLFIYLQLEIWGLTIRASVLKVSLGRVFCIVF
jgi:hypothetical protein